VVYVAGECVPGSSVGDVYFSDSAAIIQSNCWTNQLDANLPCVIPASPIGTFMVQQDLSQNNAQGSLLRRLSQAFMAPSRPYTYANMRPTPDGTWGFMLDQYADGVFPVMLMAKLPPWQGYDTIRRDSFVLSPVQIGPGAALAEVRWYYDEDGGYCTTRAETCVTNGAGGSTYNFLTADGHSGVSCAAGCTINFPAIPGRIAYKQTWRSSDGGTTWFAASTVESVAN
jgi:hypothetical protein